MCKKLTVEVIYTPGNNRGGKVNIEFYRPDKRTKIAGPYTLFETTHNITGDIKKKIYFTWNF